MYCDNEEIKIISPIRPVQGLNEERKLNRYLNKNFKKIIPKDVGFIGPMPSTNGDLVYIIIR